MYNILSHEVRQVTPGQRRHAVDCGNFKWLNGITITADTPAVNKSIHFIYKRLLENSQGVTQERPHC